MLSNLHIYCIYFRTLNIQNFSSLQHFLDEQFPLPNFYFSTEQCWTERRIHVDGTHQGQPENCRQNYPQAHKAIR